MIESLIMLLIYICILALAIYLIMWVLNTIVGISLPAKVVQIVWVIFILIVVLWIARVLLSGGGMSLPGVS